MPQYPAVLELSALSGADGFRINGEGLYDFSGQSVSSAGDVNGDGFDDLLIGAPGADVNDGNSGAAYVLFGKAGGFAASFNLSNLAAAEGFQINGASSYEGVGAAVASAGDVNGDGFDDLIIGASGLDVSAYGLDAGGAYVVFGKAGGFTTLEVSSLDGSNGFLLRGEAEDDRSGRSVASAGDINGDGFDDLIVGAPFGDVNGSLSGHAHVVFGRASGFAAAIDLSTLNGSDGFQITGAAVDERSGTSVAAAGDVNGDGLDDLIIGAAFADADQINSGASYVVFGKAGSFAPELNLAALDGANGFKISGVAASDYSGVSVASAGDVNGDGVGDLIVGANRVDANGVDSGGAYVVFGRSAGFAAELDLSTLNGRNGFRLAGAGTYDVAGLSVSSAGDFNGDGFADLLIGASEADSGGASSGASYVVFGRAGGFAANIELATLDGNDGLQIRGANLYDRSGGSVAAAGDVNGDGFDDLIIGAATATPLFATYSGASYVVFGRAPGVSVERTGTEIANRIFGGAGDDRLSGLDGADTLIAAGGDDTVSGGAGADSLSGGADDDSLSGGGGADVLAGEAGDDELQGGGAGDRLDGANGDDRLFGGSGLDRLTGGAGNDMLDGGSGADLADYSGAGAAVTVSLAVFGWQNTGGAGLDSLWSVEGLIGSRFDDRLTGGVFDDVLNGGAGRDTLTGGDGADTLTGGAGGDSLTGGAGNDRFVFTAVTDSQGTGPGADRIAGLSAGDVIDLSAIDAVAGRGDQAFGLAPAFSGVAGQLVLTYQAGSNRTLLQGDVNGDGVADLSVILEGGDFRSFTGFVL